MTSDEVTEGDVERLWSRVLADTSTRSDVYAEAEALLVRANTPIPWVNSGLTTLHALVLDAQLDRLAAEHDRWITHMREFHRDPEAAMTAHYRGMIADFAARHDTDHAHAFGRKLADAGVIAIDDVDAALRAPQ